MLKPLKSDRFEMAIRAFFMLLSWVAIIGLGAIAWKLGGVAWFAYAAVLVLIGIFWEVESSRMANVETERVAWATYRELRRIRRRLSKTPRS